MTEPIQTRETGYHLAADKVSSPSNLPGRAHARNRRGPVKRVLLVVGPFFFLVAAFALSAGIVDIVAQPPTAKPAPTLAEERAMAELAPTADLDTSAPSQPEPKNTTESLEGIHDDGKQVVDTKTLESHRRAL